MIITEELQLVQFFQKFLCCLLPKFDSFLHSNELQVGQTTVGWPKAVVFSAFDRYVLATWRDKPILLFGNL